MNREEILQLIRKSRPGVVHPYDPDCKPPIWQVAEWADFLRRSDGIIEIEEEWKQFVKPMLDELCIVPLKGYQIALAEQHDALAAAVFDGWRNTIMALIEREAREPDGDLWQEFRAMHSL